MKVNTYIGLTAIPVSLLLEIQGKKKSSHVSFKDMTKRVYLAVRSANSSKNLLTTWKFKLGKFIEIL